MKMIMPLKFKRFFILLLGLSATLMAFTACGRPTISTDQNMTATTNSPVSPMSVPTITKPDEFGITPASTDEQDPTPTKAENQPETEATELPTNAPADLSQVGEFFAVAGIAPGDSLNLHAAPGGNESVIGGIPSDGVNLEIVGSGEELNGTSWAPVAYEGLTGWVDMAFLAKQFGTPQLGLPQAANQVIQALKNQDFLTLATLVHPESGLRFSPYSSIREEDLVFTPDQVKMLMAYSRLFNWGIYDGSGESIELSFPAYYSRFIYDVDFDQPDQIGFDITGEWGSRINNIREYYPDSVPVDYHFFGFDPKYDGMDWRSLYLVFQPYQAGWKLAGIVHDEWGP